MLSSYFLFLFHIMCMQCCELSEGLQCHPSFSGTVSWKYNVTALALLRIRYKGKVQTFHNMHAHLFPWICLNVSVWTVDFRISQVISVETNKLPNSHLTVTTASGIIHSVNKRASGRKCIQLFNRECTQ